VSFGLDAGASTVMTASVAAGAADGGVFASAAGNSITAGTLVFSNSNNVSFGMAGSTVTVTATFAQSNQAASASNGSFAFQTLGFSNANNVTFGTSAGSIITASVAAGGAAGSQSIGLNSTTFGGGTGGTTGYASGSAIRYDFFAGSNITLSQSVNAASGSLTIYGTSGGGAGGGATHSFWHHPDRERITNAISQASLWVQPLTLPNLHINNLRVPLNFSVATNSTASVTISYWLGLYTRTISSISLLHSRSTAFNFIASGTANSLSYVGPRHLTLAWTTTINENDYWAAVNYRTTTGGANASVSYFVQSQLASSWSGNLGVAATTETVQYLQGLGRYTTSTTALPASIAFSEIVGKSSAFQRPPLFELGSNFV
jgi:hypothetical protein